MFPHTGNNGWQSTAAIWVLRKRIKHPQKKILHLILQKWQLWYCAYRTACSRSLIFTAWRCAICSLYYWLCKRRVWEGVSEFVRDWEQLAPHHCADGFLPVRSLSGVDAPGKLWHDIVFFRVPSRPQAPEGRGEGEKRGRVSLIACEINGYSLLCGCLWELWQRSWVEYQTGSVTAKMTSPQCKAVN